jgi:hypothetical protein
MDILHAIGNTSMVRLRKVVPPRCADVFVKLEWENPTGSVKDRMANAVISREEALFAETSSRANVEAAIQLAERLAPEAKVVALMVDSGLKYLTTDVYRKKQETLVRCEGGDSNGYSGQRRWETGEHPVRAYACEGWGQGYSPACGGSAPIMQKRR